MKCYRCGKKVKDTTPLVGDCIGLDGGRYVCHSCDREVVAENEKKMLAEEARIMKALFG